MDFNPSTATRFAEALHPDQRDPHPKAVEGQVDGPTVLRVLIAERHWRKFATFERQFRRAAGELAEQQDEPELAKVSVSPRQFERWYSGKVRTTPHPDACRVLEFMFGLPVAGLLAPASASGGQAVRVLGSEDAANLVEWLTSTSVSDEAIEGLDRTAGRVAESHAVGAPVGVLAQARQVQAGVQGLLRAGKVRHRQARELLRINGNLLAHISLLLSDLGDYGGGEEFGNAALACQREAGTSEETAWYVLAKIARWRYRYVEAADLARHGLDRGPAGAMRVQLACYEAHAAALAGDSGRAGAAMRLGEETRAGLVPGLLTLSPWSFPDERMTMFRIAFALTMDDPARAFTASTGWRPDPVSGRPYVTAAWAQIRVGAAIARLQQGALDGAAEEVAPMFALPPEFRIATVTGWLSDLLGRLSTCHYARSPAAVTLKDQIRHFTETAV